MKIGYIILILTFITFITIITISIIYKIGNDIGRWDKNIDLSVNRSIIDNFYGNEVLPKNIYILWLQGWENAPILSKKCLKSWKDKNPEWNVIELDLKTSNKLLDYPDILAVQNIKFAQKSDIIRTLLLSKYGGVWVDSTLFCEIPLDNWLYSEMKENFFTFSNPSPGIMVSNWFIASNNNNYIIHKMKESLLSYWKNNTSSTYPYFVWHGLFGMNYQKDPMFREIWNRVPKISANGPHCLSISKPPVYKCTNKEIIQNICCARVLRT